ncbi:MAG: integrase core domain-containing protein [SAR202 cluster bacterium]|nr:integrase core domain-containing protein [SAR202 cluster bacterium]
MKWIDWYFGHGSNARKACRHFTISPDTFYRWLRRYDPGDLTSLEAKSNKPKHLRQPTWSRELAEAVLRLRQEYPRWGKDKLVVLLHRQGWSVSTSMVGRILKQLKERGVLREALPNGISARKRMRKRPHAVRKPKGYEIRKPGDLVEVDTLDVRPLPGVILKHYTARDLVSRWDVVGAYTRATATTASSFLDQLLERMPFDVRAIQVDGGSEFQAAFEDACKRLDLALFVLPPRSPKLNGHVERAQRTHTEEFYEVYDGDLGVGALNQALRRWEQVYNTVRPHQSLGYLTPLEYLSQHDQANGRSAHGSAHSARASPQRP